MKQGKKKRQGKNLYGKEQKGKKQQAQARRKKVRVQQETQTNRRYRDTVFRMLFGDKKNLLELYNAVSGRNCKDPKELKIVTLENAIYMGIKNDLAFLVDFRVYLYEHQSTINFNMPFRFLQYVSEEYAKLTAGENIYGSKRIPLPAPYFIVFYNGGSLFPERQVMKLSDAFPEDKRDCYSEKETYPLGEGEPQLELVVQVININAGYNEELKRKCPTLGEYMQFVDRVREYTASMSMEKAMECAVDECIKEGILKEFLLANKAEVKHMSIYEFDEAAYEQAIRKEGYEKGMEKGMEALILDNIESGFSKEAIIAKLVKRFEISESRAEDYYENTNTLAFSAK